MAKVGIDRAFIESVWMHYYDSPVEMTLGDAALELGTSRSSVRSAVQSLVAADLLHPHAGGRVGLFETDHHDDPTTAFEEAFPMNDTQDDKDTRVLQNREAREKNLCMCGCGAFTNSTKSSYLPGHDARHAGQVGRAMAQADSPAHRTELLATLPSTSLQYKAERVAEKVSDQAQAKAERAARKAERATSSSTRETRKRGKVVESVEETFTEGSVKVGRWTYPARQYNDGTVTRNEKRDGTGEWVPILDVTFTTN